MMGFTGDEKTRMMVQNKDGKVNEHKDTQRIECKDGVKIGS